MREPIFGPNAKNVAFQTVLGTGLFFFFSAIASWVGFEGYVRAGVCSIMECQEARPVAKPPLTWTAIDPSAPP